MVGAKAHRQRREAGGHEQLDGKPQPAEAAIRAPNHGHGDAQHECGDGHRVRKVALVAGADQYAVEREQCSIQRLKQCHVQEHECREASHCCIVGEQARER